MFFIPNKNVSWASNQHIRMISGGSCDTEAVPILGFWGPYAKGGGGGGWCWGMDETYLSVLHSVSNRARETVSLRGKLSTRIFFFFLNKRLYDIQVTRFYIESVTAHRIKRNDHSCFHNSWPNSKSKLKLKTSLRARGPPGVSGALSSLRILRIGRIGSALKTTVMASKKFSFAIAEINYI